MTKKIKRSISSRVPQNAPVKVCMQRELRSGHTGPIKKSVVHREELRLSPQLCRECNIHSKPSKVLLLLLGTASRGAQRLTQQGPAATAAAFHRNQSVNWARNDPKEVWGRTKKRKRSTTAAAARRVCCSKHSSQPQTNTNPENRLSSLVRRLCCSSLKSSDDSLTQGHEARGNRDPRP